MGTLPASAMRTVFGAGLLILVGTAALAAPHHGDPFILEQPDGTEVAVRVWGDEFYQRVENLDGYTLIRDPRSGQICYADLAADGRRFVSTGVLVEDSPPVGLDRSLHLSAAARTDAALSARRRFHADQAALLADMKTVPVPASQGNVLGLTLLIDFTDEPWSVPAADFDDFLNLEGYSGYGNNGSVRDYFFDVSGGMLTYNNWATPTYLTAPNPKSYYEEDLPWIPFGARARELITWALFTLDAQGHDLYQYDSNGDNYIDALNVFYAGNPTAGWRVGLWPHQGSIGWSNGGVAANQYQITNIGDSPTLGTFCHENGHMLMSWPDLYDYGAESSGVGGFCLMCNRGSNLNPVRPCAYLRAKAGWEVPVLLEGTHENLLASHDDMNIYKIPRPGVESEYYMVECRYPEGRDQFIPDSGLAIWHIDETGSNNNEQQLPNLHYEVTLVQADGRWDLENLPYHAGDTSDLWKAPTYVEFNPYTVPAATWWDGEDAPIYIGSISSPAPDMTFAHADPPFVAVSGTEAADPGPAAAVSLVDVDGDGDMDLHLINAGQADRLFRNDGGMVFIDMTPAELADTGFGSAAAWADYDNDGDRDVYLVRTGQPNRLLEQDGGSFTDVTALSFGVDDVGAGVDASWIDIDSDGLLDLYLVQAGSENLFFHNYGDVGSGHPFFLNQALPGLNVSDQFRAAAWCDYDHDGDRDLYLVSFDVENQLLVNHGGTMFAPSNEIAMTDRGAGLDAIWGDFNNDGDWDAYTVNIGDEDVYVLWTVSYFARQTDPTLTDNGPGRSVAAADFDNDGALDLYVVRDGASDMLLLGDGGGGFARRSLGVPETYGAAVTAVCADLDGDGGVDVYLARDGAENLILRNQIVGRGHWLAVDLRGNPANRDAIGARVRLVTDGTSQMREIQAGDGRGEAARIAHFGLGASSTADSVVVTWPGGEQTVRAAQSADRTLVIDQADDLSSVDRGDLPSATRLQGAFPNPFNPQTTVSFELASSGPVRLSVYGLDGRRVIDLVREKLPAGAHTVAWQGRDDSGRQMASGTYLLRLQTRDGAYNSGLTLVK